MVGVAFGGVGVWRGGWSRRAANGLNLRPDEFDGPYYDTQNGAANIKERRRNASSFRLMLARRAGSVWSDSYDQTVFLVLGGDRPSSASMVAVSSVTTPSVIALSAILKAGQGLKISSGMKGRKT